MFQRHPNCHYPFLLEEETQQDLTERSKSFFAEKILPQLSQDIKTKALTMDIYATQSKIIMLGLRETMESDFEWDSPSQQNKFIVVVASESEACRKIWSQDMPAEFLEKATAPGGLQEFIDSLREHTQPPKINTETE